MASYRSTLFSPCPWQLMDALPTNIKANAIAIYLVIHRRGFMEASGQATVPINEISAESGVGQKATRTALRWLVTEGWVTRIDQIGGASFYRVWTDEPKRTPRKSAKGSTPSKSAKGTPRKAAIPPPQDCQGTPRNFAGDIYIQELEELEKKNSPIPVSLSSPAEGPKSEPNSPQPAAARDRGPDPEPTTAQLAIAPRTAACPTSPDPAMAALVIEAWNRHKPATWPAIQKLGAKRWPVVVEWSRELGGFQEFLDAIPIALAAAARDPWWGQKAMDWANFMGHGPKSTKQHLLRFYERGMDQPAAPSATAGLSQYVHRMFDHFGVDQSATTANPIDITETSRC